MPLTSLSRHAWEILDSGGRPAPAAGERKREQCL